MRLGSLFDGSGGFPLAGILCGVEPVWASEVEPYPIAVTRSRFPKMKHLGDISKINGAEIEPVDIVTFGSPCQDLSVAGKRAGLKHTENGDEETTRSGLFMEAVRVIKEMRRATDGKYPSFALWENVPGAFSSNKGEDFRTVLEELIKIVEPEAVMPAVPKNGWSYADSYRGDGWSLAYRVFDAQYWGVPQRRRRIHLVLDLRGERAREVLFEREGVRGYFAEGGTPWQGIAADAQNCIGADDRAGEGFDGYNVDRGLNAVGFDAYQHHGWRQNDICGTLTAGQNGSIRGDTPLVCEPIPYTLKIRSGCEGGGKDALIQEDKSATLSTLNDQYLFQPVPNLLLDDQGGQQISVRIDDKSPTLRAEAHGNVPAVVCKIYDARGNGDGETVNTLTGDHNNRITDYTSVLAVAFRQGGFADYVEGECGTLKAAGGDCGDGSENLIVEGMDCRNGVLNGDLSGTLQAKPNGGFSYNCIHPVLIAIPPRYIVRRLTPTECARLQGFPDRWGDIDKKDGLTPEEFEFWEEVRNTHAAINGKKTQEYTEAQMLTWYNKLHTDSAEYKMWGNGIALPPALYVMQGIVDAMGGGE